MDSARYPSTIQTIVGLDDETKDELEYDEVAATDKMDLIEAITRRNTAFQLLYKLAASRMFSEDVGIGMAVLMSYDYFALFHSCLQDFDNDPSEFSEQSPSYVALSKKLL
jgi:hypothetical protein